MRLDLSTRWRLRVQNALFFLLFGLVITLLAWLSVHYSMQADWTAGSRNTLSEASQMLLKRLDGPIQITAYARDNPSLRGGISRLVSRYQRYKPDLSLTFVNPDLLPEQVRKLGITMDGELYLEYHGRGERLQQVNEQALTQSLQRLGRPQDRIVSFLAGHGERKSQGVANHDLGTFGQELERIGIRSEMLDLTTGTQIPDTTTVLVIAGPQTPLSAQEIQAIERYLERGGNLLWLLEPEDPPGLQALATRIGITIWPGVVVDADASRLGIKNPAFIPIADYGPHPITESLRSLVLLPRTVALDLQPDTGWNTTVLLETQLRTWTETGALDAQMQFDAGTTEHAGPLIVGVALTRSRPSTSATAITDTHSAPQQRIVVIGDGDFLSNTYLGNGGNLQLGLNIMNWLTQDDALIILHPKAALDLHLDLSEGTLALLAAIFLIALPALLAMSGWLIWWRRQRR